MTSLHQWYLEHTGSARYILRGTVTGHPRLTDAQFIHTTRLQSILQDEDDPSQFIFCTKNTAYHQSMEDCHYGHCREFVAAFPSIPELPGYDGWAAQMEEFARKYEREEDVSADTPAGSILLRLSNCREYYFESMDICPDENVHISGEMWPHVGMIQDSVLCGGPFPHKYDLRYFPYRNGNIEFYCWDPQDLPVYIENSGSAGLRIMINALMYLVAPGEKLLITPDHAAPGVLLTSQQDLYDIVYDIREQSEQELGDEDPQG